MRLVIVRHAHAERTRGGEGARRSSRYSARGEVYYRCVAPDSPPRGSTQPPKEREKKILTTLRTTCYARGPRRVSLGTRAPLAMSGSDSPTFFHGQPWSSWIERIGRDKPLSKCAKSVHPPHARSRDGLDGDGRRRRAVP